MLNQPENMWLSPESRTGGDGTRENGPLDYGSGEYRNLSTNWRKNEQAEGGVMSRRISQHWSTLPHSVNIKMIREDYEYWSGQKREELQKLTDGKHTITIDDLLWYMRYENLKSIQELLGETNPKYVRTLQLPSSSTRLVPDGTISHRLIHLVQAAIAELPLPNKSNSSV